MFEELQRIIKKGESLGADYIDARYDELLLRTIIKENGRITQLKTMNRTGVGFNVYYKGASAYAFSADISNSKALEQAALDALGIAKATSNKVIVESEIDPRPPVKISLEPKIRDPAWLAEPERKLDLINRMESTAKDHGKDINSLLLMYGELSGKKIFTNSDGTEIKWSPYISDLRCIVVSKTPEGDLVRASDGCGGSYGLEYYKRDGSTPEEFGRNAALWAKEQIKAKSAPPGEFRALCENTLVGVLAHESFGHLTEADFIVTKGSPIHDKVGEKLGSDIVTIIDEGVSEFNGKSTPLYLPYDDEGVKTTRTVLMEDGILKNFLTSRSTAKILNTEYSGNARAINFAFPPIPRMKNTYFTPGDMTEEEALEQLGTGIYAIRTSGGQVEGSGDFLFKAVRGYWVENGEKKYPLKDVSLTGNILDLLTKIEGATKDFELSSGYFGGCGKGGQFPLPVGDGGPKLVFENVRFGGESK
ncbi:MAG: TldD/PmbA family protein [Candidatus Heimdallarchaeota archaeon]|nr:TldD/PmbA family protein [Candidatus Heimdallarchaeota archaeon]